METNQKNALINAMEPEIFKMKSATTISNVQKTMEISLWENEFKNSSIYKDKCRIMAQRSAFSLH